DSLRISQFFDSVLGIEWMHLQRGDMNQETWPDEFVVHLVIAQHVADVLTKKTFDALPEFLHAIDVLLLHSPGTVWRIGRSRLERFDLFLYPEIPGDICDQVLDDWKSFYGLDCRGFLQRQITQTGHTHELRHTVNFRRARPAFACLAVPSTG